MTLKTQVFLGIIRHFQIIHMNIENFAYCIGYCWRIIAGVSADASENIPAAVYVVTIIWLSTSVRPAVHPSIGQCADGKTRQCLHIPRNRPMTKPLLSKWLVNKVLIMVRNFYENVFKSFYGLQPPIIRISPVHTIRPYVCLSLGQCADGKGAFKYYISRFFQILDPPPLNAYRILEWRFVRICVIYCNKFKLPEAKFSALFFYIK